MKKLIVILMLLMLLFVSCGENEPDSGPAVKVDDEGNVILEDRDILPEGGEWNENWPESEYKPLVSAAFNGGAYSSGFLYYTEDNHLYYVDVNTNESGLCCFDPLCKHGYLGQNGSGGLDSSSDCNALCMGNFNILARIENGSTVLYFDTYDFASNDDLKMVSRLHRFDIAEDEVTVVAEFIDYHIDTFWFYGEDLLFRFSSVGEDVQGGIYRFEDEKLTLLIKNDFGPLELLGSDERGILWRQKNEIFLSSPDFSATVSLMKDFDGTVNYYHNGYIYYSKFERSSIPLKYEPYDGEYDEKFSKGGNSGEYIPMKDSWYRIRTETGAKEELILADAMNDVRSGAASYIDTENGLLYYVPFDPEHMGYVLWVDEHLTGAAAAQFGYSGKPIMNRMWKESGGRVSVLDLNTLETKDVYSGLDGDVYTIYGIDNGKIAVNYYIKDIPRIEELMKTDPLMGSSIDYNVYTFLPMLTD